MNTKKKTVLVAAFIVAILALAGVGYAAASNTFTGTTSSSTSNVFDVDYVTVELNKEAYFAPTTPVRITYDSQTVPGASAQADLKYKFEWTGSDSIHMVVTVKANADANPADTYKLKVTVGEITGAAASHYKVVYSDDGTDFEDVPDSGYFSNEGADVTLNTAIDFYWSIAPINITSSAFTEYDPANLQTTVTLPVITFVATGTQGTPSP